MRKKFLLVSIIPALACAAFAAPALAATQEAASENWAGYVVTTKDGSHYSAVSASWTQPTVKCTTSSSQASYSAYWVGLGGGDSNSDALEQTGTQADCSTNGTAKYYAWYELVPSAPVKLALTIKAGDKISARTAVNGDQVSFDIVDNTTQHSWSKTLTMTAAKPDTSTAEWVAEAPSECVSGNTSACSPLTLANFGTATFTNAHATAGGKVGTISDSSWNATEVELEPSTSSIFGAGPGGYIGGGYGGGYSEFSSYSADKGAAPTKLSEKGTKFSVKYGASLSTGTESSGTGLGQSDGSSTYGYGGGYGGSSVYGDGYGNGYSYAETYGYGGSYGYYGGGYGYGY
jgi:hypothetical protein